MSEYKALLEGLNDNDIGDILEIKSPIKNTEVFPKYEPQKIDSFDIEIFQTLLKEKVFNKNKKRIENKTQNITAYDLCGCIKKIEFKLKNTPIDFNSSYLPSELSMALGNSVHEFIQTNYCFTEIELPLSIHISKSLKISSRLDALINNNTLIEIKTCNYKEYYEILKNDNYRLKDYEQLCVYKYLLENHFDEIKNNLIQNRITPKFNNYKITKFQIIYICHEIVDASGNIDIYKDITEYYKNNFGNFWFIKTINIDAENEDTILEINTVSDKIKTILEYIPNNKEIPLNNKYCKKDECNFCPYKKICKHF